MSDSAGTPGSSNNTTEPVPASGSPGGSNTPAPSKSTPESPPNSPPPSKDDTDKKGSEKDNTSPPSGSNSPSPPPPTPSNSGSNGNSTSQSETQPSSPPPSPPPPLSPPPSMPQSTLPPPSSPPPASQNPPSSSSGQSSPTSGQSNPTPSNPSGGSGGNKSPPSQNNSPAPPTQTNAGNQPSSPNNQPPTGFSPPDSGSPSPNSSPPGSPSSPINASGGKTGNNSPANSGPDSGLSNQHVTIVGATVAAVFVVAVVAIFFVVRGRKKRRVAYGNHYMPPPKNGKPDGYYYNQQKGGGLSGAVDPFYGSQSNNPSPMGGSYGSQIGEQLGSSKTHFSYEEMMEITSGFSRENVIGEGGFGCVYKGWLQDGKVVAVKQLKAGSGQGEREFRAEVDIISRVHHRHLVSLVGYCVSEKHRLLIYEFVPNNTLEHHLHGKGMPVLDWRKRVKIAIGAAKGLAYLHEDCHPKIIHRDIKSANILLDDAFEAQVADFGLAKLNDTTQTHVSTRVMGTFGYLAPEYASSGKLTDRSDVFSFGVVLLELITGCKPVDPSRPMGDESLVEWARPLLVHAVESGDISELVDPRLEKHYVEAEVFIMIEAAAACVRHSAPKRPRMAQVVRALDSEAEMSDLTNGVKYGQSTAYDSAQYSQDIMRFRGMAFGPEDSAEFSADNASSHGIPTSAMFQDVSSELASDESETRAINIASSEHRSTASQGRFGRRL